MKLYKLKVEGSKEEFHIDYTEASDFINYKSCGFSGNEEEKYNQFLCDLSKNLSFHPVNIKMKLSTQGIDRAIPKKEILGIKEVNKFIDRLYK
ncbi:hypothetical protein [Clostridium folliculivorans]|uniref:Uncharacterized protein n=1 Tax=Clostridium folliculivorans TaxID=2886038 RepID=A0A9W5Y454_9CLOT|nr:hypothetical protein [Clostridium folliculivorans]GKU26224.1 hypothetical protein CFOLD11_30510 [Clostridium folliculivorans]GKU31896.1 hypothetical protein CFB3_40040 [Clostridium folliculivorans]